MKKKPQGRKRLTPAFCHQQETAVVVENFEAANKVLRYKRQGGPVGPATLARAQKQRRICYNELLARGHSREALEYEPPDDDDDHNR